MTPPCHSALACARRHAHERPRRCGSAARLVAVALLAGLSRSASAQPARTWGAEPRAPVAAAPQPDRVTEAHGSVTPPPSLAPRRAPDHSAEGDGEGSPTAATPRYTLEGVEIRGNTTTLAHVVLRFVPYRAGDSLDVDDSELMLTRFRLLGTGYFRDVQLSLRRGSRRGLVILVVTVEERNTVVVNDVWLGLSADAEAGGRARPLSAYGGLDISETNLAGTGIALGGAMAIADRQLGLRTRFSDPNFLRSSWTAEAQLLYNNAKDFFGNRGVLVDDPGAAAVRDYSVLAYQRFGGAVSAGHDLGSVSTRAFLDYRLERLDARLPRAASHRRGLDIEPVDFDILPGGSVLSTFGATLVHDTRDAPLLPSRGWHVLAHGEGSLTPLGSDYPYAKAVVRASRWAPLPWGHVLRWEGIVGGVFGDAPLFEKFYIGDYTDLRPHRALDLAFDRRPAPNFFGTQIGEVRYGDTAARLNTEYRWPVYRGRRSIYAVDFFASVGLYSVAAAEDWARPPRGYRGLARVPVDLTFNFGMRADTAAGGVSIGIANLIGFIPVRSEGP